jgi:hypothetical protein
MADFQGDFGRHDGCFSVFTGKLIVEINTRVLFELKNAFYKTKI